MGTSRTNFFGPTRSVRCPALNCIRLESSAGCIATVSLRSRQQKELLNVPYMLRSIAKEAAAQVVSWTRLDAVAREHLHSKMPYIVGYHRVVDRFNVHETFALPAMEITTGMFEKHLDW